MKHQRGESLFEFVIFLAAVIAVVLVVSKGDDPALRDGVLEVQRVSCPAVVPGEEEETKCILTVTTMDPGRLGNTQYILQLEEGEELVPDEEGE